MAPPQAALEPALPERRVTPRIRLEAEVRVHGIGAGSHEFFVASGEDIGEGGIFVGCSHLLRIGREVEIGVLLPTGEHLDAKGTVVWHRPAGAHGGRPQGMGIRFLPLPEPERRKVQRYIQAYRPPQRTETDLK